MRQIQKEYFRTSSQKICLNDICHNFIIYYRRIDNKNYTDKNNNIIKLNLPEKPEDNKNLFF